MRTIAAGMGFVALLVAGVLLFAYMFAPGPGTGVSRIPAMVLTIATGFSATAAFLFLRFRSGEHEWNGETHPWEWWIRGPLLLLICFGISAVFSLLS